MFHTGRFQSLLGSGFTEDAQLRWKGQEGQIGLVVKQGFHHFHDLHPRHSRRPPVFLGTCNHAGVAPGAVFVVDQKTVCDFSATLLPPFRDFVDSAHRMLGGGAEPVLSLSAHREKQIDI